MTASNRSKAEESGGLHRLAFRVSVRFKYILFPLDLPRFVAALTARDFVVSGEVQEPLGVPPAVFVGGQGVVGRKGDLRADMSTDKQFIGVAGEQDPKLVLEELRALQEELDDVLDAAKIEFFELQARHRISRDGGGFPLIRALGHKSKIVENASKAFSQPMELFAAQLTSRSGDPNSADYFEVWVQPVPSLADNVLGIGVVMRNPDLIAFEKQASTLEANLSRFISASLKS